MNTFSIWHCLMYSKSKHFFSNFLAKKLSLFKSSCAMVKKGREAKNTEQNHHHSSHSSGLLDGLLLSQLVLAGKRRKRDCNGNDRLGMHNKKGIQGLLFFSMLFCTNLHLKKKTGEGPFITSTVSSPFSATLGPKENELS